jgi:epoxyqueuosine reductase
MGNWIFGCDVCQSVCPWTRRFARTGRQDFLSFEPARCVPSLLELLALDEAQFRARFGRTPVRRSKWHGLLRNVVVALGNCGDPAAIPALQHAATESHPLVREHAAWALHRIRSAG